MCKDMYVRDIKMGSTNHDGKPIVLKESGATALVDGNNLLGITQFYLIIKVLFNKN